jgi:hypothetical protein
LAGRIKETEIQGKTEKEQIAIASKIQEKLRKYCKEDDLKKKEIHLLSLIFQS